MTKAVPKIEIDRGKTNKGIGGKCGGRSPKDSGNYFEAVATDYFDSGCSRAKRVIGSGSFGKITHDNNLLGDIRIKFRILSNDILGDCKFGYGKGEKQLIFKREWLDKISEEAALTHKYPAVLCKFKGERGPTSKFIVFTWDTFKEIMTELTEYIRSLEA